MMGVRLGQCMILSAGWYQSALDGAERKPVVCAAQEGRHADAEREIERTLFCLTTSCLHAKAVYERAWTRAVRTNRRKGVMRPLECPAVSREAA